ncbi:MAG: DUF3857 domain-containing protein [Cytophagales bacterium]|nr:DUF3857 domain-containing protein [Cytophagales bacterium]
MKAIFPHLSSVILIFFFLPGGHTLLAEKEIKYPYTDIPEDLLKNSNAVIREDISRYEILEVGKGILYVKRAITILNKKADHFAEVGINYYGKLTKNSFLKARSYDKTGRLIKQLKSKDVKDLSSFDGYSIYSDNRIKYFDLRYPDYPYTIEYEYKIEENGFMSLENWVPYSGFNVASQKSSLAIIAPENYIVRYLELNIESTAKERIADGKKKIMWEFGSFPAIKKEPRMPPLQSILPQVITAPTDFEMEGYYGNMDDWASFGKWEKMINQGRDILPEEYAAKLKGLIANEPSRSEKIKKVYEYLQNNTRYVSIQLGIGGWQTYPASSVASNGYGDCKALSNYMKSMLKSIGIDSYYTLVRAGYKAPNIIKEFSSNQFNHMILCVPNYQDTIWLECTNQDNPFGYLGKFTSDRDVLVINDEGGKIVRTKAYTKKDNGQYQITNVFLDKNGSAKVSLSTKCTGLQYENYAYLLDVGESEQKKWLFRNLDIPGFELDNFILSQEKKIIPEVNVDIDVSIQRFASVSGKRLFFQPNVFNKSKPISIPQKDRQFDFVIDIPFEDFDTVRIETPQGYHLEFIPENVSINSKFGKYESNVTANEELIIYTRMCSMEKGTFQNNEYMNYVKFMNEIAKADKLRLVLVKST